MTPRLVSSLFCLSFLQHLLHCHGQVAWACLCTISSEGVKGGIPKGLLGLWWISCANRQKSDEFFRKKTKNFLKLFGGHSDENHAGDGQVTWLGVSKVSFLQKPSFLSTILRIEVNWCRGCDATCCEVWIFLPEPGNQHPTITSTQGDDGALTFSTAQSRS